MMDGTQTPLQQLTMQVSKEFHLQMRELCGDNFDPVVTLKNARNERINICHNLIQY